MEYLVERYRWEEGVVHTDAPQEALMCATVSDAKDYRIISPVEYTTSHYSDAGVLAVIFAALVFGYGVGYVCGWMTKARK